MEWKDETCRNHDFSSTKTSNKNQTMKALITTIAITVLTSAYVSAQAPATPTIESLPPVVVKAVPESGTKDVSPGIVEIKVTFSKQMSNNSWSWSTAWKDSTPEIIGKPRYEADHKTCVIKVKLEPGKTYGYWINSQKFTNFRDKHGRAAVPYLLVFSTKKQ